MYAEPNSSGTPNPTGIQVAIGELISGYTVCPNGCEILEFFDVRTAHELRKSVLCPKCGKALERIPLHVITV